MAHAVVVNSTSINDAEYVDLKRTKGTLEVGPFCLFGLPHLCPNLWSVLERDHTTYCVIFELSYVAFENTFKYRAMAWQKPCVHCLLLYL